VIRRTQVVLAVVVALGVTALLGALSRVPYQADRSTNATLRLAWRTRGVRVEECRQVSAEELEKLPPHMRRSEICEGRLLPYQLRVLVDGDTLFDQEIRPAGAREDRPLFVFEDFPLEPGTHSVTVSFERDSLDDEHEGDAIVPERLTLERDIDFVARRIELVTYDSDRKALVLRE